MGKKGHVSGGKVGGNHTTIIPAAEKLVKFLRKHRAVTNVALGEIGQVGNGPFRVSVKEITGGLEVKVRGTRTIQTIKVYTSQGTFVARQLRREFDVA